MRYALLLMLAAVPGTANATAYPSLSCAFTEPFINFSVWPGAASLNTPESTTLATSLSLSGTELEPVIAATIAGTPVRLEIENVPGGDGMSDFESPLTGHLRGRSGGAQSGACVRFPDGTAPRPVIGVGSTDQLMVRVSGSARARTVGSIHSRGRFWAFPEPMVRGWARGAFEEVPAGESGRITVRIGWVNARFLGRVGAR